jgi:hypothetical protein
MNAEYKKLLDLLHLHCLMNQDAVEHMLRVLVDHGWTLTRVEWQPIADVENAKGE